METMIRAVRWRLTVDSGHAIELRYAGHLAHCWPDRGVPQTGLSTGGFPVGLTSQPIAAPDDEEAEDT
jgi:hypothetical protein